MAERSAPPSGHVGPWNPHKVNAPKPPVTSSQGSVSAQQGSLVTANTSNTVNYPDVTLDSGGAHNPGISNSEDDLTAAEHTVVPDYPLDSLQRPTRTSTSSQNSQGPRQSHNSGNAGSPRGSASSNVASTSNVSASRTQQAGSSSAMLHSSGMSPRTGGGIPPPVSHVRTVPHSVASQPVVSHSNVSVNVTSASTDDTHQQIRTQDLNVGVTSSRLDIQRQTTGALPDLIAHSQIPHPTTHPAQSPTTQRPQPPIDPRAGSYVSRQDHHPSRHRHHHSDRRHRSRRHSHRNTNEPEEPCKETCFKCIAVSTSFRWILVVLSLMGVCCVVTGIVLAALHASGNSYLFLAIMFIGK